MEDENIVFIIYVGYIWSQLIRIDGKNVVFICIQTNGCFSKDCIYYSIFKLIIHRMDSNYPFYLYYTCALCSLTSLLENFKNMCLMLDKLKCYFSLITFNIVFSCSWNLLFSCLLVPLIPLLDVAIVTSFTEALCLLMQI